MGSLKAYGAISGLGKGLSKAADYGQELRMDERRTEREIALQGMQDRGAMDRQDAADAATAEREESRYGPGGYEEAESGRQAEAVEAAGVSAQQRAIALEELKQKGRLELETQRISEKEQPYTITEVAGTSYWDPQRGTMVQEDPSMLITDNRSGLTFKQTGTDMIPQGGEELVYQWQPNEDQSGAEAWVTEPDADNDAEARQRADTFLTAYGYLPASWFTKYARYNTTRTTESAASTSVQPQAAPSQ